MLRGLQQQDGLEPIVSHQFLCDKDEMYPQMVRLSRIDSVTVWSQFGVEQWQEKCKVMHRGSEERVAR